jgi:hypothetical protein
MVNKAAVKDIMGDIPLTAEVYWYLIQRGKPITKSFSLRRVEKWLPEWSRQAESAIEQSRLKSFPGDSLEPRRIWIFSTLRYWIEHATLVSLALAGMGHQITFTYLPYASWNRQFHLFDLRRHRVYAQKVFKPASSLLHPTSLLDVKPIAPKNIPDTLKEAIREVSLRDVQYTLQVEDEANRNGNNAFSHLYELRLERNTSAAAAALAWIQSLAPGKRPEVLLTPNGSILEMGVVYQVARYLGIPIVTYEFGEQRERIWLAQDSEVMLQETDALWDAHKNEPLNESQWAKIRDLYDSRQNGKLWENFSRLWQGLPSQGGNRARTTLGLDSRPVVLLAANVIGDSLTLGRQVFSKNMTEWLERSIQFFAGRPDVQLIVRIHPGERYLKGPSVAQVARTVLPDIPAHIHLVEAPDPINTYDLVEIADLGLAYTTTVGMEMAMGGVPVIIGGRTHYRGKGFTLDPNNWEEYHQILERILSNPREHRLSREQVESSWRYAYRFFFDYPSPFPWHLLSFWDELETWSMERVLSDEGQALFGDTFSYLVGEPRKW